MMPERMRYEKNIIKTTQNVTEAGKMLLKPARCALEREADDYRENIKKLLNVSGQSLRGFELIRRLEKVNE